MSDEDSRYVRKPDTCLRDEDGYCRLALAGNSKCFVGNDALPGKWCHNATEEQKRMVLVEICATGEYVSVIKFEKRP